MLCVTGLVISRHGLRGRIAGTPGNRGKLKCIPLRKKQLYIQMHFYDENDMK